MILVKDGAIIAEKYRLQRPLGRGGMGSVWLARHLMLDADVAIKFISPEHLECPEARLRFEREAKISAQLRAPNVAQVYDYGVDDGTPYLVMELLEGEDLAARLQRERRLDPLAVLSIVQQVCKALRRAHEVGLVHRDLKPANIFLTRQDDEEIVKILDFGIAKMTGIGAPGSVTKAGTLLGSPFYMSPEQVRRSKDVDSRSDLWSLGVITFQCLSGQHPFQGEDIGELIFQICAANVQLAVDRAPELDAGLVPFFTKAFSREPTDRFQTAQEFAAAFAAVDGLFEPSKIAAAAPAAVTAAATPSKNVQAPPVLAEPETFKPSDSTLSPTGHSVALTERRGLRIGAVLIAFASALVLTVLVLAIRSKRVEHDEVTGPSNATPAPQLDSSSVREKERELEASASTSLPNDLPSADAGREDAGSSAEPEQSPPSSATSKKGPPPSKKPKGPRNDPTKQM